MSFVYYSLTDTFGPNIERAEYLSTAWWSTPLIITSLVAYLTSIDFSNYDNRRTAIDKITSTRIPQFFYTYSFDPTDIKYILVPPFVQTRFPGFGSYIYINNNWLPVFQALQLALSYRDSDGPIDPYRVAYQNALTSLDLLLTSNSDTFDRFQFEIRNILVWAIYPFVPIT